MKTIRSDRVLRFTHTRRRRRRAACTVRPLAVTRRGGGLFASFVTRRGRHGNTLSPIEYDYVVYILASRVYLYICAGILITADVHRIKE